MSPRIGRDFKIFWLSMSIFARFPGFEITDLLSPRKFSSADRLATALFSDLCIFSAPAGNDKIHLISAM